MRFKQTGTQTQTGAPVSYSLVLVLCLALLLGSAAQQQAAAASSSPPPTRANVMLWNKLETQQLASEIGPNLLLTSYIYPDWQEAMMAPAKFGNGLFVNHDTSEGWLNNGANFFAADLSQTTLTPERGAIEFWFEFKYDSSTWNHAYFFDTRNTFAGHYPDQNWNSGVLLTAGWNGWNYGSYGKRFFFGIGNGPSGQVAVAYTPDFSANPGGAYDFHDGTLMHFGFVWDVAGIDGSTDTVRIYIDGQLAGAGSGTWPTTSVFDPYLFIGSGPNCCGWDQHYNAVKGVTDNLVIWNVAKTDFSGRLVEDPVPNQPPNCTLAAPSMSTLWPPSNKFARVSILGVTDPDGDPLVLSVDRIFQDEPVGKGNSAPDGSGIGQPVAELRAERLGAGNGRVYHVDFTASDGRGGSCTGTLFVSVPHDQAKPAIDGGALYDSTVPSP